METYKDVRMWLLKLETKLPSTESSETWKDIVDHNRGSAEDYEWPDDLINDKTTLPLEYTEMFSEPMNFVTDSPFSENLSPISTPG